MSVYLIFLSLGNCLLFVIANSLTLNLNHSHLLKNDISSSPASLTNCSTSLQNAVSCNRLFVNFYLGFNLDSFSPSESDKDIIQWSVTGDAEISQLCTSLIRLSEISQ